MPRTWPGCTARNWRTCDTMAWVIDGIDVRADGPRFGLSVTDALGGAYASARIAEIRAIAEECPHLRFICVRDDARDPDLFCETAGIASASGLGMILESHDPPNILRAASGLDGHTPLVRIVGGELEDSAMVAAMLGTPLAVPGDDVQSLMDNAETAESMGAEVVLDPAVANMKGCLEMSTDIHRLWSEHGIPLAGRPLMVRAWSGEYALAVASVSVMCHGDLVVLDDLDPEACRVLDALMSSVDCKDS